MSDAIDRDAVEAILRRRVDGCYGDCTTQCLSCAAKEDIEEIRSLPAVPPAAERRNCLRLRIDKDDTMGVTIWHGTARVWMDGDSLSGEEWASTDLAAVVRWLRAQTDQFAAAYRAATHASTGAAPPAAEPAPFQKPPGSLDEAAVRCNNPEPAKEPAPCGTCGGSGNDPYTMTGEDGTKPCATCGGVGIVLDGPITHVTKHCPSCRPGGAA